MINHRVNHDAHYLITKRAKCFCASCGKPSQMTLVLALHPSRLSKPPVPLLLAQLGQLPAAPAAGHCTALLGLLESPLQETALAEYAEEAQKEKVTVLLCEDF